MADTIILQGKFTSAGTEEVIPIRSDIDWMEVMNDTTITAVGAGTGVKYYWQRGMAADTGYEYTKLAADESITFAKITSGGFTLVNEGTDAFVTGATAYTGLTNVVQPIIATGSTAGLSAGSVVRLSQTLALLDTHNLLNIDIQIDTIVGATSFRVASILSQAPGAAGGAGQWRKVNVQSPYYPKFRYIVDMDLTAATAPIVTTSVDHGYKVGQKVKFKVASAVANGMSEINNLVGTITVVPAVNTFTVDIDTTGFTAFKFPTIAEATLAYPFTPAYVLPVGMDTPQAITSGVDLSSDSAKNISIIGMKLASSTASPAGVATNVIYWRAGKSFSVSNL